MNNDDLKKFANILFAPSERDNYKRRIDKAIEYIEKELKDIPENGCSIRLNKVLDILKGSDTNE